MPLSVLPGDSLADVVRRAMVRSTEARYAPVAACDELGRLQGLVPFERLLQALADQADGRPAGHTPEATAGLRRFGT